jgi:hypothetical protein
MPVFPLGPESAARRRLPARALAVGTLPLLVLLAGCASIRPLPPEARAFTVVPESESGFVEPEDEMDFTIPAFDPLTAAGSSDQILSKFRGVHRKTPKTTIASASRQTFADVAALAADLPDDADMLDHTPPIDTGSMVRAVEEVRNVKVTAWIYAIKYEADQDWHVIIGTDPAAAPRVYFNAEISGLPGNAASAYAKLKTVRQALAALLDDDLPGESGYRKYTHPIPVRIEGSLFFDVDHAAGNVGPAGMRPTTAWEIHPITKLSRQ